MGVKAERKEAIFRIVVGVISGIILYVLKSVAYLLIAVHLIYSLITGKRIKALAEFIEYWNTTLYVYFRYMSGVSNKRPFPFSELSAMSKFEK